MRRQGRYTGQLNAAGEATGLGIFVDKDGDKYEGTFINNKMEGYCKMQF